MFKGQRAGKHGWNKESKETVLRDDFGGIGRGPTVGSLEQWTIPMLKSLYFIPRVMGSYGKIPSSGVS